jgi:flagellar basal-body rod modification protein FlgD
MNVDDFQASTIHGTDATTQATNKKGVLGKDDFLKLFAAQMANQDPMNPTDDKDFMGQMASFSTLEQVSNMATANSQMASSLALSQSVGLIGRTVTYTDANGSPATGVVQKVNQTQGGTVLTVDGTSGVDPSTITQIA